MEGAWHHEANGDYGQAILAYLDVLSDDPLPEEVRQARYGLAMAYLLDRQYVAAAVACEDFIAAYPEDDLLPHAMLMAARAYHGADVCAKAIPSYQVYLTHETLLVDLVYEWIGDCHAHNGEADAAIGAYRQALDFASDRDVQIGLREKIAVAHQDLQDYDAAVVEYDALLALVRSDHQRARMDYLAGQSLAAAGRVGDAQARYRRAVNRYPEAEHAYLSLVELVDAGLEVDEFQRGLVDYYAGTIYPDATGAAIRAFDRYLAAGPTEKVDEALYFKALAHRAAGEAVAALEILETLAAQYAQSPRLVLAWSEKAATLAQMGDVDQAVATYKELARRFPDDELAPRALWRAARLREGEGAYLQASALYEEVQATFPAYEDAAEALWRAGLASYRAGDAQWAATNWQLLVERYPKSSDRARALYWLGKLASLPGSQLDGDYWDQLISMDPDAYYGLRVQQVRTGESVTASRLITAAVAAPQWDAFVASAELLAWLNTWTHVPTDTNVLSLPAALSGRRDFRRAQALLAVGLRRKALDTYDKVRSAVWDEPLSLVTMALYFRDVGFHGLAARCALRLAALWPGGSIYDAPAVVQKLAFPLVYVDLLSLEAETRDLDPLLLAALVRQESLFEPVAESSAGARGLGQVMPATGEGIARSLDMDDFVLDDLYRPWVSIRFGAFYLGVQMKRFDDQILVALAAYNGGPGNTLRWVEAGGDDLDMFVETITASQSRRYLQRVYEQYLVYERLYRSGRADGPSSSE